MRNYVIINGVNSLTIQGLAIKSLPPITKTIQRNMREEIDGRDGDIITELGYGAYDKAIEIGLFGSFNIDEVIAFFNQKGTITFSNESDKVYYFQALDQVDYAELLKFRTATINLHIQPFKYPIEETPIEIQNEYLTGEGESITLQPTKQAPMQLDLKGNTSQETTTGKNLLNVSGATVNNLSNVNTITKGNNYIHGVATAGTWQGLEMIVSLQAGTYYYKHYTKVISGATNTNGIGSFRLNKGSGSGEVIINQETNVDYANKINSQTFTISEAGSYVFTYRLGNAISSAREIELQNMIIATTDTTYEPYSGGSPAPNPNYPRDINVVSGDNTIYVEGKNLLDFANGTGSVSNYYNNVPLNYTITSNMVGNSYSFSFDITLSNYSGSATTMYSALGYGDTGFSTQIKQAVYSSVGNGTYNVKIENMIITSAMVNKKLYVRFAGFNTPSTISYSYSNVMLEKGTQATTYEPYKGNTYPIYLTGKNLANYLDIPNAPLWDNNANSKYVELKVKPNTQYTMSSNVPVSSPNNLYFNGSYATSVVNVENSRTMTSDANGKLFFALFTNRPNYNEIVDGTYYIQIEEGSVASDYVPFFTPIELCKIGTYQDYIYKENGSWYLHKEIGKVILDGSESWNRNSGNGAYYIQITGIHNPANNSEIITYSNYFKAETANNAVNTSYDYCLGTNTLGYTWFRYNSITLLSDFKTWLSTNKPVVYYPLATPTNTEITDTTLISQLEATKESQEGQTNISQENNDLPFIISASALKEGSGEATITNSGNIYSKPTIELEGTGNVQIYLDGSQAFEVDMSEENNITIDTDKMEAYNPTDNTLSNRKVTGDYSKFKLNVGDNEMSIGGDITKATISNYTRWL